MNDELVFDGNISQNQRPVQIDPDKIIQYEMMSKGSEHMRSMQGGNGQQSVGGGVGMCTNNSFGMVSGSPTEVSNYFNQQTYYNINYINGPGCQSSADNNNINNGPTISQNPSTLINNKSQPYKNFFFNKRTSSVQYPYSHRTAGIIGGQQLMGHRTTDILKQTFKNIYIQELDFNQFEKQQSYMQSVAILSPRHIRAAVLNYDTTLLHKDSRWGDMSILQKLYFLFESLLEMETQLKKYKQHPASSNDSNEDSIGMSRGGTVTVLSSQGNDNMKRYQNMSEASIRPEERQLNAYLEEVEQLRNQVLHKNSRIDFMQKKIELLEEQSHQLKDRIKQNIDQYEQEIKLKEEISLREKEDLFKEAQEAKNEIERLKREFQTKEQHLKNKIKKLQKMNQHQSNDYNVQQTIGTQSSSQYQGIISNARGSLCSLQRSSIGGIQDSLQSIEISLKPHQNLSTDIDEGRCSSGLGTQLQQQPQMQQTIQQQQPSYPGRTIKKSKIRLSVGDGSSFKSSRASHGLVLKSDQIKRIYNNGYQNVNNNSFLSPQSVQRRCSQVPMHRQQQLNACSLSYNSQSIASMNLQTSQINLQNQNYNMAQQQKRDSINNSALSQQRRGSQFNIRDMQVTVRSKTPNDSFALTQKNNDFMKYVNNQTFENEPLENGKATAQYFRDMKSQSIHQIMSPTNYTTDTAQFFADLNQTYNLGTAKRYHGNQVTQKGNNLKVMRGSIGGKLQKIKIKQEGVSAGPSVRNSVALNKKNSKGELQSYSFTNTLGSPVGQPAKSNQIVKVNKVTKDQQAKNYNVENVNINIPEQNQKIQIQQQQTQIRPRGKTIPAKSIKISPYQINWHNKPAQCNTDQTQQTQQTLQSENSFGFGIEPVNLSISDYQSQGVPIVKRKIRTNVKTRGSIQLNMSQIREAAKKLDLSQGIVDNRNTEGQCIVNNWTEDF